MYTSAPFKNSGFTLIEMMISIGLILVLSAAIIPSFNSYLNTQYAKQAQEQVKSDFRTAQNNSLAGVGVKEGVTNWGLKWTSGANSYTLFASEALTIDSSICQASTELSEYTNVVPGFNSSVEFKNSGCLAFSTSKAGERSYLSSDFPLLGLLSASGAECYGVEVSEMGLVKILDNISCN
jgi:prepilin-type N-terminal cleavage/methylation domain-containing protein